MKRTITEQVGDVSGNKLSTGKLETESLDLRDSSGAGGRHEKWFIVIAIRNMYALKLYARLLYQVCDSI